MKPTPVLTTTLFFVFFLSLSCLHLGKNFSNPFLWYFHMLHKKLCSQFVAETCMACKFHTWTQSREKATRNVLHSEEGNSFGNRHPFSNPFPGQLGVNTSFSPGNFKIIDAMGQQLLKSIWNQTKAVEPPLHFYNLNEVGPRSNHHKTIIALSVVSFSICFPNEPFAGNNLANPHGTVQLIDFGPLRFTIPVQAEVVLLENVHHF